MSRYRPSRVLLAACALAPASLAQELLYEITGPTGADSFGTVILSVGDVDLDGFADFVVGDPNDDTAGSNAGRAFLCSGSDGSILVTYDSPGEVYHFGTALARAGDVDGDGDEDLLIGAPRSTSIGEVHVVDVLTGAQLLVVVGTDPGASFGAALAGIGDIDADGHADFVVGSPQDDGDGGTAGNLYAYSGADGTLLYGAVGNDSTDLFGSAIAALGDVDGDGVTDLAVGAWSDDDAADDAGAVHVLSGATGATLFEVEIAIQNARLGSKVAACGDVNADGIPDLATSAPSQNEVYVLSGADGAILRVLDPGGDVQHGNGLATGGDLNGDGVADLLAGAPGYDTDGMTNVGAAFAWTPATGSLLYVFPGLDSGDFLGESIAILSDVNGDGIDDLALAIPSFPPRGLVQVWAGSPGLCPAPVPYCITAPNSVGSGAHIGSSGSTVLALSEFELRCDGLPSATAGLFFFAPDPPGSLGLVKWGNGWKCTEGPLARFPVTYSSAGGAASLPVDFTTWPGNQIAPGESYYFQYWYRDPHGNPPHFNLSDALAIVFCP